MAALVRPDAIVVSAGYDYASGDPVGDLGVDGPGAAAELASLIREVAETYARGRVVYCLEGGYDPQTLAQLRRATLRAHDRGGSGVRRRRGCGSARTARDSRTGSLVAKLIFALRLGVGGLLLAAGILKAMDGSAAVASTIAAYRILPGPVVAWLAVFLPYFEIFLGLYLVAGLLTRIAASVAAVAVRRLRGGGRVARRAAHSGRLRLLRIGREHAAELGATSRSTCFLAAVCAAIARFAPGVFAVDRSLGLGGYGEAKAES